MARASFPLIVAWLEFQPRVALATWIALVALFSIAWVAYAIRSRARLRGARRGWTLATMLLAGGVPLMLLLNPTWVEPVAPPDGRPLITMLIDTSASMSVQDGQADQSRVQIATELARKLADEFGPLYEHRILAFDAQPRATTAGAANQATGLRTDIAAAIIASAQSDRPRGQAVILISDGIHNVGSEGRAVQAAKNARSRAAPVYPIRIGRPQQTQNLAIATDAVNRVAFVGQPFTLTATVRSRGFHNAPIQVQWAGAGLNEQPAKSLVIQSPDSLEVSATAELSQPGIYRFSVRVGSLPGEATEQDNNASVLVRVLDRPIRVLLLEGKPYWDSKFLARNLAADRSIQLESLVMMRADRYLHRQQSSPRPETTETTAEATETSETAPSWQVLSDPTSILGTAESLQSYQVIVLGRDAEAFLDHATVARLRQWVSTEGGSLVCARGAPQSTISEKLGRMLPVRWSPSAEQRLRARATAVADQEGWWQTDDVIDPLSALPSLVTSARPATRGGLPRVLVTGADDIPLLTYQPFGSGRTVVVEGAGMWRWALLPPEFAASDDVYPRVWNGLLHWLVSRVALAPGQRRALQSDRAVFSSEVPATATLLVRNHQADDAAPSVLLVSDDNQMTKEVVCEPLGDQVGVFVARFGTLPTGSYRATLVDALPNDRSVTAFEVRTPVAERLELSPDDDLLREIARHSGGQLLESADVNKIAAEIDRQITDSLPVETRQTPAWDRWWVLICILGLWTAAWTLRRSCGLV